MAFIKGYLIFLCALLFSLAASWPVNENPAAAAASSDLISLMSNKKVDPRPGHSHRHQDVEELQHAYQQSKEELEKYQEALTVTRSKLQDAQDRVHQLEEEVQHERQQVDQCLKAVAKPVHVQKAQ